MTIATCMWYVDDYMCVLLTRANQWWLFTITYEHVINITFTKKHFAQGHKLINIFGMYRIAIYAYVLSSVLYISCHTFCNFHLYLL